MASRTVRIRPNRAGLAAWRRDLARGIGAVVLDGETESKRETPVHGGYRSFRPGEKPIGGTLRRSVHSAVFLDGRLVFSHVEDGKALPPEEHGLPGRIVGYVGTNTGYGVFVHLGTSKMPARAFLSLEEAVRRAPTTIRRAMGRIGR